MTAKLLLDVVRGMSQLQLAAVERLIEQASFRDASVDPIQIAVEIRRLSPSQLRALIKRPVPGTPVPRDGDGIDTCGREYELLAVMGLPEDEAAVQLQREKDQVRLLMSTENLTLEQAWARVVRPTRSEAYAPGDDDASTSYANRIRRVRSRLAKEAHT